MANCYCVYCGQRYLNVSSLTSSLCSRHPNGSNKGKHVLYEGSEKSRYTCKYCGQQYTTIASLTSSLCSRHPEGANKGKHSPAL